MYAGPASAGVIRIHRVAFFTESPHYTALRRRMVAEQLRARGIRDERVLAAMSRVPRHEFADLPYRDQAYQDHPLPIGEGQTISQPYIVAIMLEALAIKPTDKVLEIGTGSGYATALLSELAARVYSIERHARLAGEARLQVSPFGFTNVTIIDGDGNKGFAFAAPYDAILVSAAAAQIPPALLAQLAEGGRMILPVGPPDGQQLQLIRMMNGQPQVEARDLCRFVPLVSGQPVEP
jgi:protein-L-isoaspartate(D-aspartate) O-methyltransferase